ncbi:PilZ domain-containing protein [Aureimonas sp. AU4]|uniref:PilZ domain-containing protein n=1 Tax=Aureimonas sp. AU4 TaxID=1638163 RepID=UPI000A767E11|nr:PilZ domain-containing protein [Aureimonas sp. AU4]
MAATAETAGNERRIAPRTRTLKRGKILSNNRFSTYDCIVRNISATGALLTIDAAVPLPKEFEIRIGEDDAIRPAKLVYRRELFAGIHFLDTMDDEGRLEITPTSASEAISGLLRWPVEPLPHSITSHVPWRF